MKLSGCCGNAITRAWSVCAQEVREGARRSADEEDAALSAFDTFCRRAEQGRFPDLKDRNGLWALLVVLTGRKAANLVRHGCREKRGGRRVQVNSAPGASNGDTSTVGLEALEGHEPTPEEAALLAEEVENLLDRLADPALCQVAVMKLEGFTNAEVATRQSCSVPTVERRLAIIRRLMKKP